MATAFVGRLLQLLRRQRLSVRGRLMATAFVGRLLQLLRRQRLSVRGRLMVTAFVGRLLQCYRPQCVPLSAKLLGSLVDCGLCTCGSLLVEELLAAGGLLAGPTEPLAQDRESGVRVE